MAKSCVYEGKEYSDGAVTCQNGKEYRCNDGTWDSLGSSCGNTVTAAQVTDDAELRTSKTLACLSFFSAGISQVGIRNNCSECKVAVVNWQPQVGIRKYKVQGYSQIVINIEAQSGQLIGEDPC